MEILRKTLVNELWKKRTEKYLMNFDPFNSSESELLEVEKLDKEILELKLALQKIN